MSAWRTPPSGEPAGQAPQLHIDQIFIPIAEELLTSGQVRLPVFLMTMHYYLVDIDEQLCPTWVVPGSHLSGRAPGTDPIPNGYDSSITGPDSSWQDREQVPVLCEAGDGMLFRSEIWHRGSQNISPNRARYLLQVHYGQRGIAQRFPPYLEFRHNPAVLAAASKRQLRLLGKHHISAYG